jgi:hypothetical protein
MLNPTIFVLAMLAAADPAVIAPYIKKNCVACHNKANASGDIDLFTLLNTAKTFDAERDRWERAAEKIKHNEMPPAVVTKRPAAADSSATVKFLEDEFARQDRSAPRDPGRVTARRLNRTEYNNTVRDLLGVDIRPADSFPNDETAYGFDNNGDALTLSSVLLERYLYAAERVVRTAIFGPEKLKPAMIHYPTPVRINDVVERPTIPKDLFHYDETGLSTRHAAHISHRFPVDGEYSIRLILNGHRPNGSEPVKPALYIDGKFIRQWEFEGTDLEGQSVEVRTFVKAGEHMLSATYLKNYHGLPASYKGPEPSKITDAPRLDNVRGKLSEKDIETLRKYGTKIKTDRHETRIDNRYEAIDIGGPFRQTAGPSPESLRRVFVCAPQTDACAQTIIRDFARRAFRRPVSAKDTAAFEKLYRLARQQRDSFQEGISTALQGVLVSPHFLFRMERDPRTKPFAPISEFELASRLSYFLWSSMPDAELLAAAEKETLRQPAVLRAQVQRMLRDARSRALVDNFAGQWLQFKNIDVLKPDVGKFPYFEDSLRDAMRRETELFLENLIRNDASVLEILDSNHTYMNERLARFYGIPGILGPEFRRVDMSKTQRGGGVLAHASILTISSYSTRTSPVLRGKWILENLLNAPPPPPPPAVPSLDEGKIGQTMTLRQQMEAHRANPACASCHARMDPLGFGLENLNAIGEWREKDGALAIDSSGVMPDGRKFSGPAELKVLLKENREAYVKGLTDKLLTYALGRGLERFDKPVVSEISGKLPAHGYRFSSLVLEIVNSLPFQQRRSATASAPGSGVKSE